jgi:hypothetical protein
MNGSELRSPLPSTVTSEVKIGSPAHVGLSGPYSLKVIVPVWREAAAEVSDVVDRLRGPRDVYTSGLELVGRAAANALQV